jgi:glycosyltransferase involved in cell wall biosynthesis
VISNGKVTVLHVISELDIGGAENILFNTVRSLDPEKYESVVCALTRKGILSGKLENLGYEVLCPKLSAKRISIFFSVFYLAKIIWKRKVGLVHTHLYHANLFGRLACAVMRRPCVISVHNVYTRKKFHRQVINRVLHAALPCPIISGSSDVSLDIERYDGVKASDIVLIPNSVDLSGLKLSENSPTIDWPYAISGDRPVVGTIGRLEPQKGHKYLISAVADLIHSGVWLRLVIVGDGSLSRGLRAQAADLGISDHVVFTGTLVQPECVLPIFDLFVMPSLWEGLSLAMLLAMGAGIPTVATDVGGVRDIFCENKNGFLIKPRDITGLSRQIRWCLENFEKSKAVGKRGQDYILKNHSLSAFINKLEIVYSTLLSK